MDPKQRVRRVNRIVVVVSIVPFVAVVALTILFFALGWPTWTFYAICGVALINVIVSTRITKRFSETVMRELPIREPGTPYDPENPSVSAIEIRRYEWAQEKFGNRRTQVKFALPFVVILAIIGAMMFLSIPAALVCTFLLTGAAVMSVERMVDFAVRTTNKRNAEQQYQPTWWLWLARAVFVCRIALVVAFLVVTAFGLLRVFWLGLPLLIGGLIGWFATHSLLPRLERAMEPPNLTSSQDG